MRHPTKRLIVLLTVLPLPLSAGVVAAQEARAGAEAQPSMVWVESSPPLLGRHGPRAFLGIRLLELSPELRAHFGVPGDRGLMVARVEEGGPAAVAGIAVGDILLTVAGTPLTGRGQAALAIGTAVPGETVEIELWRGDEQLRVAAVPEERAPRRVLLDLDSSEGEPGRFVYRFEAPDQLLEIDPEVMETAFEHLHERLEDPAFGGRLRDLTRYNAELEQRLETLEARLDELRRELERLSSE